MGLLAGLDALVVALALLGAMFAVGAVFRPLLVSVLGSAPFIGGWLAANVDRGLASFQRSITAPANASLYLVTSSLSWLATQGRAVTSGLTDALNAVITSLQTLATVTIPAAISASEQRVEGLIEGARAYALLQVQALEVRLQGDLSRVEADGAALVDSARREALDEVSAAERVVLQEIRKTEQATGQLFLNAEHDAQQLAASAEQKAVDLVAQARALANAGIAAVEHDLQALERATGVLVADTTAVIREDIGATETRTKAQVSAIEADLQAQIDQVIKSGPWGALVAAYEGGEVALKADVETLVKASLAEVRALLGDAEAIRAKYGPAVRAQIEQLKAAR